LLQRFVVSPGSAAGVEDNVSIRSLGQHWQGSELAEERRLVLQLASATAPDADRNLLVAARLIWASVFGTPRTSRGAKLWCGAISLRKAFGPRLHGCGAVGNMLQTALQRLQVLSPTAPPTKH
jgi:hypothetical protein